MPDQLPNVLALAQQVEEILREVQQLRIEVDELRQEIDDRVDHRRQREDPLPPRFHLTSMPLDPTLPDFHRRVNAVDARVLETFEGYIAQLKAGVHSARCSSADWIEDQDFELGCVVEIDAAIQDWYAEYYVVVKRGLDWFLADGGEGWFTFLWQQGGGFYLRLLTEPQEQAIERWTGLKPELEEPVEEASSNPVQASEFTQQAFW